MDSELVDRTIAERNGLAIALEGARADVERLKLALQLERAHQSEMNARAATVYAVVYSNYSPPEINSLWRDKRAAEARADLLGSPWRILEWDVG